MHVLNVRNVHEALPEAVRQIYMIGTRRESRYGDVLVSPDPVTTVYRKPLERVIFHPLRDANPFHNFFEGLWMLAGRNDVAFPARFAPRMLNFSDDGETLHGAYGYRWRKHFLMDTYLDGPHDPTVMRLDQLREIIRNLRADPTDRRQILQMWDPAEDLLDQKGRKDIPCNVTVHFQINMDGALDMSVFCRSNDIVWGAYGSDAVHFSMLMEYMATAVGVPVGRYWQISSNWHGYVKTLEPVAELARDALNPMLPIRIRGTENPYISFQPFPMINGPVDQWDSDLLMFLDEGERAMGYRDSFFRKVALPVLRAHTTFKDVANGNRYDDALRHLENCAALDWKLACEEWILRRYEKMRLKLEKEKEDGDNER